MSNNIGTIIGEPINLHLLSKGDYIISIRLENICTEIDSVKREAIYTEFMVGRITKREKALWGLGYRNVVKFEIKSEASLSKGFHQLEKLLKDTLEGFLKEEKQC